MYKKNKKTSNKIASLKKKKKTREIMPTRLDFDEENGKNGDSDLEKEADLGKMRMNTPLSQV